MHLLGRDKLNRLQKQNQNLDKWLSVWTSELLHARWWSTNDVLNQFPKAQERSNGLFLFQTEPRGYCIKVQIAFPQGIALITDLIELIEDNNERH
ncbi:hypothetical protein [Methylobacter sp.]|uniref:hypothetical protein n=1 Tax=Methylobacter sp. TaxID=2051955 RepID=UPI003DA5C6A8